jgi:hypothetical protein
MKSFCFAVLLAASMCGASERPNIIIMMTDDSGYSDLGCYGGEIDTPNLNRMAANGLRFRNFYNNGRCSPTRASLMTGKWHLGGSQMKDGKGWQERFGIIDYREILKIRPDHTK